MKPPNPPLPVIPCLGVLLGGVFCLSLVSGRLDLTLHDLSAVIRHICHPPGDAERLTAAQSAFLWIRLPRCLMAVWVGAGLAVSGAVFQALFRNPLVSPDILGVSAGCTFGAALGLMAPWGGSLLVHLLSFACGLSAVAASSGLARAIGHRPVIVLVLSGMVVMSFFNALLMAAKYFSDPYDELPGIVFWVMGSLNRVTWEHVLAAGPVIFLGTGLFFALSFRLNILSLGDVQATSLGLNPGLFRGVLIVSGSVLVALSVSVCGQIAWIGLVIPHMARTLAGPNHEKMLPVTALLGSLFLLAADMAARSLTTAEIPVGIVTALAGAPLFGLLLLKNRGAGWM